MYSVYYKDQFIGKCYLYSGVKRVIKNHWKHLPLSYTFDLVINDISVWTE